MTYALSWALQQALFTRLTTDPGVTAALGGLGRILDQPAHAAAINPQPLPYVIIGDDTATARGDQTATGAEHRFDLVVHTEHAGFAQSKQIAAALCDALLAASLPLARGRVVLLDFVAARTDRTQSDLRTLTLSFRALLDDL